MINEVFEQLSYLKLKSAYSYLRELHINGNISENELTALNNILKIEVKAKEDNSKLYNVKVAAFPYIATIDDYDFSFQRSLNENKIRNIVDSDFLLIE